MPAADVPFAYAILRVVPRVERGERLNVGVVVFCRQRDFLDLRAQIDDERLTALAPDLDAAALRESVEAIRAVVCGEPPGGALAALEPSERFGWVVAPASTILQPSQVHTGLTDDPAVTLERLFESLVATAGR
ncbi:MAG TPA: DUF3037 domain-containing protein [Solirubrobacteraceae bacterium]|nr:DUF3037 domain-containing protein [Solirubrobacteraceae bacterium]